MYIKEFPFNNCKYPKICGLVRGQTQERLHQYFPFFLYIQKRIYVFFNKCRATRKLYEKSCNSLPLIFNELQANYMEMKVNCKTIIFNELQLYQINCNDIKRRKSRCRNFGFNMLNPLSLFKIFLFLNYFIKLLLLFVLLKITKRILFSIHSFSEIFSIYIKLFFFFFFLVIGFT